MGIPKQSIIEVNGKRYDARTGRMVSRPQSAAKPKPSRPIQDFARVTDPAVKVHRSPQRSQTLMRTGVKRPAAKTRPALKPAVTRGSSDIKPIKPSAKTALLPSKGEADRMARAAAIKQNKLVRKFGDVMRPSKETALAPRVEPLPVQPIPLQHQALSLKAPSPKSKTEAMLERGLRSATSHTQKTPVKPARARRKVGRFVRYGAGALSALLLVGFIAYQNMPNISLRYAVARSGVAANLPGYQPAGFALNSRIKYNPGQVVLSYQSNSDDRNYTITQSESNWNSDTLMSNYVATKTEQPQRYEDKGRTIYLYGESNATLVSNGVWYDIKGDAKLTSDQLIRIATSL